MSREAHVRFCESLGLQRPGPLTKKAAKSKKKKAKAKKANRAGYGRTR
jgi:hypothetical protein